MISRNGYTRIDRSSDDASRPENRLKNWHRCKDAEAEIFRQEAADRGKVIHRLIEASSNLVVYQVQIYELGG